MNHLFDIPEWMINLSYSIFMLSLVLIVFHLIKSKCVFEKVLALDLLAAIVMCIAVVFSIQTNNPVFLEISLCIAIIGFLGTVAFARFLGRE
jgi:multicomponent Na+:H+ antiporter subunit F